MLKVLWVVNVVLPEAKEAFNINSQTYSGGWLIGAKHALENRNVIIDICFPYKERRKEKSNNSKTTFYSFRKNRFCKHDAEMIVKECNPQIIHVFGSEQEHSNVFINVANKEGIHSVLTIQGIVSEISRYVFADLPFYVRYGFDLRNIIMRDNVCGIRKQLNKKGKIEKQTMQCVNSIVGRTEWDRSYVHYINESAKYFHVEETLRDSFYSSCWEKDKCADNSILISQISSPAKGFHFLINAIEIVKKEIPNISVKVAGKNIMKEDSFYDKINKTYYMKYCKRLIEKKGLSENFVFLGMLNEENMLDAYLKCNVFVMPSLIENSSNSICEAMILGVPIIASFTGGTPSLISHGETGLLYTPNDYYLLATRIISLLRDNEMQLQLSQKERKVALRRHDKKNNAESLLNVYLSIMSE